MEDIVKAKARLVAKEFSQKKGMDYFETFSPTPSSAAIRVLVSVALSKGWDLHHLDAEQAFVQPEIDAEVYMIMPQGYGDLSGMVVRLNKSLYSIKQVARSWYSFLISKLQAHGFEKHGSEQCLFTF